MTDLERVDKEFDEKFTVNGSGTMWADNTIYRDGGKIHIEMIKSFLHTQIKEAEDKAIKNTLKYDTIIILLGISVLILMMVKIEITTIFSSNSKRWVENCVSKTRIESLDACNQYECYYTVFGGKKIAVPINTVFSNGEYICDENIK